MNPTIFEFSASFRIEKRAVQITVFHNLDKKFGLSIEDAFQNWLFRTDVYTSKSFCKYVMSKDSAFVCMTEKQWKRLNEVKA